ncbi:unnamed protein product [Didymodactylos carnosus]|uniref:O-methyltransferase domain-containing protein n=2 Tax=Didymodactylos carnosus TaxID=1234261 RepID=A0A814BL42_9BILA|nr:unnamed protein product [Didymodactylos carnosus]CAF3706448.1 unnamed protein product [Didymodactylos carnosus]
MISPMVKTGLPKFMSFLTHRYVERALWAFAELGVADQMASHESPLTAAELSRLNGNNWNSEFLYRVLRTLADADVVIQFPSDDEDSNTSNNPEYEDRFQLTDSGLFLTTNHPSNARDIVRLDLGPVMEKSSTYLPSLIQNGYINGNGFEQAVGDSLFDYLQKEENKEYSVMFNNAMSSFSNYEGPLIASVTDFSRFTILVDIGGGVGTLLSFILEQCKQLNGIVFDLDHVIENAKTSKPNEFEAKQIEHTRYQFISGDMFKSETIPQADAYMMKFIMHDWNDEKAIEILKSIRLANKNCEWKTITIFIADMMILPNNINNWEARAMDIEMLSVTSAKERTKREYIRLLEQSGYVFKQLYQTSGVHSVIEATAITNTFPDQV